MSKVGSSGAIEQVDEVNPLEGLSAGSMLRNAREAAGISVEILAVSLKIPAKKLEALENDGLHKLHDAVFVRGLASGVCRHLKLDPTPVLAKLPQNAAPRISRDERGINQPFRTSGDMLGGSFIRLADKPQAWIIVALMLGIATMVWYPEHAPFELGAHTHSAETQVNKESNKEPMTSSSLASADVASGVPSLPASGATTELVYAGSIMPKEAASFSTESVASLPLAVASSGASGVAVSASPHILVLKAKATSWVQVLDAQGVVLVSRAMSSGEVVEANGATPMSVVVGRVDAVDVTVRGTLLNLAGVARENVARFEVK